MTLTLELSADQESRLQEAAQRRGVPVEQLAGEALEQLLQDLAAQVSGTVCHDRRSHIVRTGRALAGYGAAAHLGVRSEDVRRDHHEEVERETAHQKERGAA
jgi:hypothetical protein